MTPQGKPRMGLCPIGKFVFSNEDAVRQKQAIQAKLDAWEVPYVDLEGVLEDGLVKDQAHVDAVVEHFRREEIDCLFLPHCNFGTEGAVGMIAHKLGVPTLLWGPRDEAPEPDGTRLRDTLCGLFASSKVLHKLGVAYSYIENCRVGDAAFEEGVDRFLRAVAASHVFRGGARIGHLGQRIDFFWTTIVNESELLERFGVEVLPLDMVTFLEHVRQRVANDRATYDREIADLRAEWKVEHFDDDTPLANILAVRDQLLAFGEDNGLDGFAIQDFNSLIEATGAYCMLANAMVGERYAIGFESDIHGALSDLALRRAAFGQQAIFLADLTVRHPENDNAVLMWHCGAPLSMKHPDAGVRLGKHWILPAPESGMTHYRLHDGPITIARFDGDRGEYALAVGEGRTVDGPETLNNYAWMEVSNWPAWERALIEGPFIHHAAMGYGRYGASLIEACRFVPGLEALDLG